MRRLCQLLPSSHHNPLWRPLRVSCCCCCCFRCRCCCRCCCCCRCRCCCPWQGSAGGAAAASQDRLASLHLPCSPAYPAAFLQREKQVPAVPLLVSAQGCCTLLLPVARPGLPCPALQLRVVAHGSAWALAASVGKHLQAGSASCLGPTRILLPPSRCCPCRCIYPPPINKTVTGAENTVVRAECPFNCQRITNIWDATYGEASCTRANVNA